jgi:phenylacetate-CoA ligase
MEIWETIEFGARALLLKPTPAKSSDEIGRLQRSRLEHLVEHARTHSKFWREKLRKASKGGFDLRDILPSNKPELMDNFDRAVTADDVRRDEVEEYVRDTRNLGKYFRGKYALSHTSGSQGQPLLLVQTRQNLELLFALQVSRGNHESLGLSEAVKHLVHPARLAAVIFKPGFYPSSSAFHYMPEGVKHYLKVELLCANDDDLFDRLNEFRPTHLTAYASMLHEIAREIESGRLTLKPEIEEVVNISERLMPQAREHYSEIFGAPILDNYSMGECLFLTNGCCATHGMHVNADWAILEVVDENNQPVPDGTKGAKVLVTNLANHVQPIIRYEIGDMVTMATEPCGCDSNMPLIDHIDGRDSDVFHIITEEGERSLQPTIFELALGRMLDVREYQIIQEDDTRFRILVEPLPGAKFQRERSQRIMNEQLREYGLDRKLEVELEAVERLVPETDQKFRRVVGKERDGDRKKAS